MKKVCKEKKKVEKLTLSLSKGLSVQGKDKEGKITFYEEEMVMSLLKKKFFKKYRNLIKKLYFLLSVEDESGTAAHEALNQIEKFRLELQNKYRKILKEKEAKKFEKELAILKEEALRKVYIIEHFYTMESENTQNKSR